MQLKRTKANNEKVQEAIRKREGFYLSWSDFQQAFELKKLSEKKTCVLPGLAEVKISHISSAFGQTENVLKEIKQREPKSYFQCVAGSIEMMGEGAQEFKIGDEVIVFMTSKWMKSRILVPVKQMLKRPPSLSKQQAAVASGMFCFLLSYFLRNIFFHQ